MRIGDTVCGEGGTESMEVVHGVGHLSEVLVSSVVSGSTRCLCQSWEPEFWQLV